MRVLCVVPLYPPQSRVGAWLATHEFLAGMVRSGHTVDVVRYLASSGSYVHDGVTVHPGTADINALAVRADVVVGHLGDDGTAARTARDTGTPLVVMVHGKPHGKRTIEADLAVFNSHATREQTPWDGRFLVVHPPVWPDKFRTTPGDAVTQVNLSEAKGGGLFWVLSMNLPHRDFLGVRGGYAEQVIRKGPNVTHLRTTETMRDVYARTRVLLMPSHHESWGMVGLEAMCSGIPVIAHPTPGLRESLGDAGIFVDRNDLNGWREAIESMYDPDVWTEASERARARAEQFDPQADVDRFVKAVEGERMRVVVLVPRRADNGRRDEIWEWVSQRWAEEHPTWDLYEGHHNTGRFNRSAAINRAAKAAGDWDVAVIADADAIVGSAQIKQAVKGAHDDGRFWLAYTAYHYLSRAMSDAVMSGFRGMWEEGIEWSMTNTCSTMLAVRRDLWDAVGGFDEGFDGWGSEDVGFANACTTLGGGLARVDGALWHLHHPSSPENNHRSKAWQANVKRGQRYGDALGDVEGMEKLLADLGVR